MRPFEGERLGHDGHGQSSKLLGGLSHDRRGAASGSSSEPASDENHVGTLEDFLDFIPVFLGGLPTDFRIHPGPQSLGEIFSDVHFLLGFRMMQRLGVGVYGDEFNSLDLGVYHPAYRVVTRPANSDNFYSCKCFDVWFYLRHNFSINLLILGPTIAYLCKLSLLYFCQLKAHKARLVSKSTILELVVSRICFLFVFCLFEPQKPILGGFYGRNFPIQSFTLPTVYPVPFERLSRTFIPLVTPPEKFA